MHLLSPDPINPADLLREFETSASGAGAVVSFTGIVRPESTQGAVKSLFLQAYSPMTERGIEQAIEAAKSRWEISDTLIVHRIGDMQPGDPIVVVATASRHRRAAFEAADFLMDYLKTDAIFWKKEVTDSGAAWIEPRGQDYRDARRWMSKETA